MGYAEMHQKWLASHLKHRSGERKSRLQRGHGHGERLFLERVWWPIFGHFNDLHPEYEVIDWRGQSYFVDFLWIQGHCKFIFEIKGYGPHVQNTDRIRYRRELNREVFLSSLGYRVLSIPYDELDANPQLIVFLIKSLLTPFMTAQKDEQYSFIEREILSIAIRKFGPIRPADLVLELQIDKKTAVKNLNKLCAKGKLNPVISEKSGRVMRYELVQSITDLSLW